MKTPYKTKQQRIVEQLHRLNQAGVPIRLRKRTSNLFRDRLESPELTLDFTELTEVIHIDTDARIVEVEAATTYKDLLKATLLQNFMPAVVPQFTTITVGGGVSGGACEASSFRYGATHETVTEMTVLLSSGEVVVATPTNRYRDLFFALPHSFGSLGYILKLKLMLVPVKPYVHLRYLHFTDTKSYFATLKNIWDSDAYEDRQVDFLDGMVLGPTNLHLVVASFVDQAPYTNDYTYMKMYYKAISSRDDDYLTVHDFVWRWEADWTWGSKVFGMQHPLLRLLLGKWMLNSTSYWRLINLGRRWRRAKGSQPAITGTRETMIQDAEIPFNKGRQFLEFFMHHFDLRPIWVCPMQGYADKPFTFVKMAPRQRYMNYGFWGAVTTVPTNTPDHFNRLLESSVGTFDGVKALYSNILYTREEFWNIYDKRQFDTLKAIYDPSMRLQDLYEKIVR